MEFKKYSLDQLLIHIVDNRGRTCPTSEQGIPLIATNCIKQDSLFPVFEKIRYISQDTYNNWFRSHPKPNDIIFVCKGSPGRVAWTPEIVNFCIAQDMVALRANPQIIDPKYLFALLRSDEVQQKISNMHVGTLIPHFKKGDFKNLHLDIITDLTIQKEIGNKYFQLLEKIEINTQINQTLEQIAQALFKSWFVDFDPVRAKVQALSDGLSLEQAELAAMQTISGKTPEELTALSQEQPERYAELAETAKAFPCEMMEIDGVEVPKGWEVKRIDEVIQKIPVGKKYSSKTAFSEGLVPILDQGRSGVIGYHNDKPGIKASIEDPIIVFANHTCYMRLISYDFSAIQNVFAFKGKECNLYWLYLATLGKQEFVEYKGHFPDFLIKEIIAPPKELTELFGKYIKESFSKIFINDRENSILAKIRDLLLP
ncbi:MAG: restriction endonuclease subunit S, partial [Flavobacteriaceae bacterium]